MDLIPVNVNNPQSALSVETEDIPNDPGKMFIGGLSWQTTPEGLKEYFGKYGDISEVMVMKDPSTRRSRGFGFVTFSDANSVDQVLAHGPHDLDGKKIDPKVAFPRRTHPKLVTRTKKIFVGGISATTSLEDIKKYFEQFGEIEDAMLMFDKQTNRHRGFGFVTFVNEDIVDKVCEIHFHEINNKMVECKKAQPKEVMLPACPTGRGRPTTMASFRGGYGEFILPQSNADPLASFRFSPYALPQLGATGSSLDTTGSNAAAAAAASFHTMSMANSGAIHVPNHMFMQQAAVAQMALATAGVLSPNPVLNFNSLSSMNNSPGQIGSSSSSSLADIALHHASTHFQNFATSNTPTTSQPHCAGASYDKQHLLHHHHQQQQQQQQQHHNQQQQQQHHHHQVQQQQQQQQQRLSKHLGEGGVGSGMMELSSAMDPSTHCSPNENNLLHLKAMPVRF
ncbi:RNA-binding protein Musashi homolog Rbp6-like isoform X1 [Tigriopus californicus]|uniref:RNA-binding protein Musashi homolog Rbp6-like isoform X1 n=1 Tax=Tigriopus californicus TaxID=6832 RepID=UPI0027D9FAB0|nr:RNA-binding protein Musashi homolog Rbp6-like isoform X1 [Tigriopus californicus]